MRTQNVGGFSLVRHQRNVKFYENRRHGWTQWASKDRNRDIYKNLLTITQGNCNTTDNVCDEKTIDFQYLQDSLNPEFYNFSSYGPQI